MSKPVEIDQEVPPAPSPRAIIRRWVRERLEDAPAGVSIPDLVDEAIGEFASDKALVRRLYEQAFRDVFYDVVQQEIANSRGRIVQLGDDVVQRDDVTKRARKWAVWYEHVGDHHVRLFDMTREDLLLAKREREERGRHEYEIAALWGALAERLEGGQVVAEVFSEDEIEGVIRALQEKPKGQRRKA